MTLNAIIRESGTSGKMQCNGGGDSPVKFPGIIPAIITSGE